MSRCPCSLSNPDVSLTVSLMSIRSYGPRQGGATKTVLQMQCTEACCVCRSRRVYGVSVCICCTRTVLLVHSYSHTPGMPIHTLICPLPCQPALSSLTDSILYRVRLYIPDILLMRIVPLYPFRIAIVQPSSTFNYSIIIIISYTFVYGVLSKGSPSTILSSSRSQSQPNYLSSTAAIAADLNERKNGKQDQGKSQILID